LSTQVDLTAIERPAIAFYPDRELNSDSTNWSGPNPAAAVAMLRVVGFREVRIVSRWSARDATLADMNGAPVPGHVTVHAWR
jgi:hypothetical protein